MLSSGVVKDMVFFAWTAKLLDVYPPRPLKDLSRQPVARSANARAMPGWPASVDIFWSIRAPCPRFGPAELCQAALAYIWTQRGLFSNRAAHGAAPTRHLCPNFRLSSRPHMCAPMTKGRDWVLWDAVIAMVIKKAPPAVTMAPAWLEQIKKTGFLGGSFGKHATFA